MIAHGAQAVLEREDSDEVLVERVRRGDNAAFEDLYRRHSRLAVTVARKMLKSPQDAEDAAAEAFTNVLSALRRQVGPRDKFRPYLMACVRNTCLQRIRRAKRAGTREQTLVDVDVDVPNDETVVEGAVAAAAFQSMPARWQSALWMAEVLHLDADTIAERLDVNVAAAGALVYRARQGFTEAYLAQHVSRSGRPSCAALGPKLAQYVRGTAGLIASRQVQNHINECSACSAAVTELSDVNSSLRSLTGPLSVVTAAGATAAAASGGTATATLSGFGFGWLMKAAAIAALSTTPLLVGGDAPTPAVAADRVSTTVTSRSTEKPGAPTTTPVGRDAAAPGGVVTEGAPTDAPSPRAVAAPTGLTTQGTADAPDAPTASSIVPTGTTVAPPAVPTDTRVDSTDGDSVIELPALPTLPPVVLPTIPAIGVPAIPLLPEIVIPLLGVLPGITIPAVSLPAINVPAISVPPITLPPLTLPPLTLPTVMLPPIPLLAGLHLGSGGN